jgi:hypothetical protein
MAEVVRSTTRRLFVRSRSSDRMAVWHLRDFVRALDEEGVDGDVHVTAQKSTTGHLTTLTVVVTETELPTDGAEPEVPSDG